MPRRCSRHPQYLNSIGQAHGIIFPADGAVEDDQATKELYVKTHGDYDPGQQRTRGYNWDSAKIDPATHAFGLTEKVDYQDGVAKALNPDLVSTSPPPLMHIYPSVSTLP